jgi:glycosidase
LSERYGALYALRVTHEALRYGTLKPYSHPNVLAFERILDGDRVLVVINTRANAVTYNLPTALQGLEGQELLRSEPVVLGNSLALAAHEVRVVAVR